MINSSTNLKFKIGFIIIIKVRKKQIDTRVDGNNSGIIFFLNFEILGQKHVLLFKAGFAIRRYDSFVIGLLL